LSSLHDSELRNMHTRFKEQLKKVNQEHHNRYHEKKGNHEKGVEALKNKTNVEIENLLKEMITKNILNI